MLYIKLIIVSLFLYSCNSSQKLISEQRQDPVQSNCPEDGICTFEALSKKSMIISKGGLGELYPEITNGDKILLKFDYKRDEIPNVMDSSYNEIIYLELDPNNIEMEIKNSELEKVKLTFARFCYCKGQTGYYKIKEGNLSIKKTFNERYNLILNFNTNEVPQIITTINVTFELK